jgi:hypothetical protein
MSLFASDVGINALYGIKHASDDRSWAPEIAAGSLGASLPLARLYQYHTRDVPAMRSLAEETPIYSPSEMARKLKFGDIGFEGELTNGLPFLGATARGAQGSPWYHSFVVGPRHRLYHGGGHSIFGDQVFDIPGGAMQATLNLVDRYKSDPAGFVKDLASGQISTLSAEDLLEHFRENRLQNRTMRSIGRNPEAFTRFLREQVPTFKGYFNQSTDYPASALFMRPNVKMTPAIASDVNRVLRNMVGTPYSMTSAVGAGARSTLLPTILPGSSGARSVCIPGTSTCGELPAAAMKAMGIHPGFIRTRLPVELMQSEGLRPVGMTAFNMPVSQLRRQLTGNIDQLAKSRTRLGLLLAALLGGAGFGSVALRRRSKD